MRCRRVLTFSALLLSAAALYAINPDPEFQRFVARQRASALPRNLVVPAWSIAGDDESDLFLVSKITDPLPIDIFAMNADGQQLYLGQQLLPPSRGETLSLRKLLGASAREFSDGWLRLDYAGDKNTLQAWVVIRSHRQVFEVPFMSQEKMAGSEYYSFWSMLMAEEPVIDAPVMTDRESPRFSRGAAERARAEYRVMNNSAAPVGVTMTNSQGTRAARVESFRLGAWASRTVIVSEGQGSKNGWLRLVHDGAPGSVAAVGLYRKDALLAYIPVVPAAELKNGPKFEILHMPEGRDGAGPSRAVVTLFNSGETAQEVTVSVVSSSDGTEIGSRKVALAPRQVSPVDLRPLLGARTGIGTRIRISGTSEYLMVDGSAASRSGELLDMSVHSFASAHKSGTYPIPDLAQYDVRTTIVNLSDEPSQIIAQYFWDDGVYAVPIFSVPPNGTAVLDPKVLAASGRRDAAKRLMDANGQHMALKWSVRSGSHELLGRTEASPVGSADGFGFNCGGCCPQFPVGEIVPGEVELGPGDFPSFETVSWWQTCTGTIGPWYSNVIGDSVPSPFSWDYFNLAVSNGADDDIGAGVEEEKLGDSCFVSTRRFWNWGRGKACDKVHNPNGYSASQQCTQQTSNCTACVACCLALYNAKVCKGGDPNGLPLSERQACEGNCATDFNCG